MAQHEYPLPISMDNDEIAIFSDSVGRFFDREVPAERVDSWRAEGQADKQIWKQAGVAGLLGLSVPEDLGGAGGDFRHDVAMIQQAARRGIEGFAFQLHNVIVLPYILLHGTDEQKRDWLPRLCAGGLVSAIAMSEPGAGSDLQAIKTTATRDSDGYRINGAKTFISNGQTANFIVVAAKTDPAAGAKGISLFCMETERVSGFSRGRKLDKIGHRAQDTSELFFDHVWVPCESLLGGREGRGFAQLMAELPRERLLIAIEGVEAMDRAIGLTVDYTKDRKVFGQSVFDYQNTQFKLAEAKAVATVARAFINQCIDMAVSDTLTNEMSAIAKLWVSEQECKVVDECLQLFGGYGYISEYPISHLYRNARIQRIYGGTNEIMKMLISRSF